MAIVVACRLAGWDTVTPSAQLVAFTPYLVPGALLLAVIAGAGRRWRTAAVAALLTAAVAALLVPRAIGGDAPPPPGSVSLRVMTVNVWWHADSTADVLQLVRTERRAQTC